MAGPKSPQIAKLRVKWMDYSVRQQKTTIFLAVVPVDLDFLGENGLSEAYDKDPSIPQKSETYWDTISFYSRAGARRRDNHQELSA